jgi:hypothetical protein
VLGGNAARLFRLDAAAGAEAGGTAAPGEEARG